MLNKFSSFTLQARNNYIFNMMVQKVIIRVPVSNNYYKSGNLSREKNSFTKKMISTLTQRTNQLSALLLIALLTPFQQFHYQS